MSTSKKSASTVTVSCSETGTFLALEADMFTRLLEQVSCRSKNQIREMSNVMRWILYQLREVRMEMVRKLDPISTRTATRMTYSICFQWRHLL